MNTKRQMICPCGTEFLAFEYKIQRGQGRYCSRPCADRNRKTLTKIDTGLDALMLTFKGDLMTQEQIATACGVTTTTIRKIEKRAVEKLVDGLRKRGVLVEPARMGGIR